MGMLQGLSELREVKCSAQCLTHSKNLLNVGYCSTTEAAVHNWSRSKSYRRIKKIKRKQSIELKVGSQARTNTVCVKSFGIVMKDASQEVPVSNL